MLLLLPAKCSPLLRRLLIGAWCDATNAEDEDGMYLYVVLLGCNSDTEMMGQATDTSHAETINLPPPCCRCDAKSNIAITAIQNNTLRFILLVFNVQ